MPTLPLIDKFILVSFSHLLIRHSCRRRLTSPSHSCLVSELSCPSFFMIEHLFVRTCHPHIVSTFELAEKVTPLLHSNLNDVLTEPPPPLCASGRSVSLHSLPFLTMYSRALPTQVCICMLRSSTWTHFLFLFCRAYLSHERNDPVILPYLWYLFPLPRDVPT
jgi:hypothetical protein